MLKDAETNLKIYAGLTQGIGALDENKEELKTQTSRRHCGTAPDSGEAGKERIDIDFKQFGPRADSVELLKQSKTASALWKLAPATNPVRNSNNFHMQPLWQATVAQHQLAQLWAVRVEPPRSVAEADFVTLARTYVLVGNWSDWGKF
eukprot:CAMPEP_0172837714 /NCGR_PEP_ID=MMETSP1075-20121228/27402_1 /TAXON_ID=2916 /ORGANISM="Ceratium fusus, Strain PA161109" /LENGTH=147 /DNA_ID=CAMNT_0013681145 /DNA_START=14 /DNA_END=455 /DNA_ORIENTATION=+